MPLPDDRPDANYNHPKHYNNHPSGMEAIELCEHVGFNVGNAIKYLFRADHKGRTLEDLNKTLWYLTRERESNRQPPEVFTYRQYTNWQQVLAYEPFGQVLGDVLRAFVDRKGINCMPVYKDALDDAINRVKREIEERVKPYV